jgi:hypothetical protein
MFDFFLSATLSIWVPRQYLGGQARPLVTSKGDSDLDLAKLISDLQRERDRLGQAITALLGSASSQRVKMRVGRPKGSTSKKRKSGGLTPEGRRRLSLAMKKRWAEGKMKKK